MVGNSNGNDQDTTRKKKEEIDNKYIRKTQEQRLIVYLQGLVVFGGIKE